MSFVYEDEMKEVTIKGEVYSLRTPSALEQEQLAVKFEDFKAEDNKQSAAQIYVDFFFEIGLPKEVSSKMSMKGLLDLFQYVLSSKKN